MQPKGRPFEKGKSGNPAGRPKASVCVTTLMRMALLENDGEKARALAESLIERAIAGSPAAINQVLNRVDGPVPQRVRVSELSGEQLIEALEFTYQDESSPEWYSQVIGELSDEELLKRVEAILEERGRRVVPIQAQPLALNR